MNHLDEMDYLRDGIGLRGYGQRDPLVEYKREAYHMFSQLLENIRSSVVRTIFRISLAVPQNPGTPKQQENLNYSGGGEVKQFGAAQKSQDEGAQTNNSKEEKKSSPIINKDKVGRNDPCPCGSGKKYKKCCGK